MHSWRIIGLLLVFVLAACGTPQTTTPSTNPTPPPAVTTAAQTTKQQFVVGIVQQVSHPALDASRRGVEEALAASGLNIRVDSKNAQNDPAVLITIVDGFRDDKVSLVVAVGTQPLQAALKSLAGSGIPIVFNAVTDPYKAGAAVSPTEHPGVTGIQSLPPVTNAFDVILKVKPETKRVGIIWTTSEKNSEVATGLAREYAKTKGIEFIEAQVTKADEVLAAAESLAAQKVDAIFISTDSTVVSALDSVVRVAGENKIGLFCNDPASARRGCATGLGLDYYDNGYSSAIEMVIPILQGTSPDTIAIRKQEKQNFIINTLTAAQQGLTIPADVLATATEQVNTIVPK